MGKTQPTSVAAPITCASHWPSLKTPGNRPSTPAAIKPHNPPTPCTEIAPPGSSIFKYNSSHSTENVTSAPATRPTINASAGTWKAAPALDAASPATQPLALNDASGFPKRVLVTIAAANNPDAAVSMVSTAISGTLAGVAP